MSMYNDASLALIPSAVGDGVVYNARPVEVLGAELVTNGDFSNGTTGWTSPDYNSTLSIVNGELKIVNTISLGRVAQGITTEVGKKYLIIATTTNIDSGTGIQLKLSNSANLDGAFFDSSFNTTANALIVAQEFTATATTTYVGSSQGSSVGQSALLDKVSVKEVLTSAQDFDFTRASEATRVLSGGRIEKVRTNSLLQSNQFDTTWAATDAGVTSGQSGYDGTNNAWSVTSDGTSGFANVSQSISFTGVHTISIYAKAGSNAYLTMRSLTSDIRVQFKLDDGTHYTTHGSPIDTFMEDAGDGWYRCGFTANFSSASGWVFYPQPLGTIDAGNIYIQDAQLEQGLAATEYIETTGAAVSVGPVANMPRLDWSGGTPSLLLEPQSTNLITYSEDFSQSYWAKNSVTLTSGFAAPDGSNNAYKIQGTINTSYIARLTADTNQRSIYAKTVSGTATVNLLGDNSGFTVTEDWQRFEYNPTSNTYNFAVDFRNGTNTTEVLIWGYQSEALPYPTSYIPSYGTATTRAVDACLKTGISSLIGQTEGTLFVDFTDPVITPDNSSPYLEIYADSNNRITVYKNTSGLYQFVVRTAAATQVSITYAAILGEVKVAVGYAVNDVVVYVNGAQAGTDTAATIPACSGLYIGGSTTGVTQQATDGVNQALLFTTRLSNTELEKLTTL